MRMSALYPLALFVVTSSSEAQSTGPIAGKDLVFEERGGWVAVEAEHFYQQTRTDKRRWHLTTDAAEPSIQPDGDPAHLLDASGGAYLEALPDTRRSHQDELISGENFSNQPGRMGVLSYKVWFRTPGRYYVWARIYSTNTEDNGLHVGIDGKWPASGQRMQWTAKRKWVWNSKQRTQKNHGGERHKLFLMVDKPGLHTIHFSMREDGTEFDRWLMTKDRGMATPDGFGPPTRVREGVLPKPFPLVGHPEMVVPRGADGDGDVRLSGAMATWHKITLTLNGPFAHERDRGPNPFLDYRFTVRFAHESGEPSYRVPGYFAADGDAANSSAQSGSKWRAHLAPDKPGRWNYRVEFVRGERVAIDLQAAGARVADFDGKTGSFTVGPSTKRGRDFRSRGRLEYVGSHHLRFAGSGEYFLKAGTDAPETFLAYEDFDGTATRKAPLKTWRPHVRDWREGDPVWQEGKGKGIVGALNYLASEGLNAVSFLTYNAGGDGDNVWPMVAPRFKLHYDCSKLDQWQIVFDHAQARGIYLHFKLQESENDDAQRHRTRGYIQAALDQGKLGVERKLYCREMVARFGHALALNWNLGEENSQSHAQQRAMARYLRELDPYDHHLVVHTFPNEQDKVYAGLVGERSVLTGASLQNAWNATHRRTLKWLRESLRAGRPWVVANDEQGPASYGVPQDPGYGGKAGGAVGPNGRPYDLNDIRRATLWGNLMAGGAGVEYYFGYKLPQNDLVCEDFRSRDRTWDFCRHALGFFRENKVPFHAMKNANALIGNSRNDNSGYCLAKAGELYLVFLMRASQPRKLDLSAVKGEFQVRWFDPREGGELQKGSFATVRGGGRVELGAPPKNRGDDWLVVVRR